MYSPVFAGQQSPTRAIGKGQSKRPSLFLTVPKSRQFAGILEVDLGSPFDVSTPSPLSLSFDVSPKSPKTATTSTPRTSVFFDWDKEVVTSSPVEDEEEGGAQIITIAPGKPFYLPPKFTSPPSTPTFVKPMVFACGALADSSFKSVAQVFHEELERILRLNDKAIVFDAECLQEMETELLVSPVDVFSDLCLDSMRKSAYYSPTSPTTPVWRAPPDVPHDFGSETLDGDLEELVEDSDDDEDYSSDEAITPPIQAAFTVSFDKRQVAPFEEEHLNRYTLRPSF